ncbi:acetate kinase [Gloeomargarita lithophora Alchichica-D10]|uniref:Acetate kinase n=1 Tax=Gloeomargarita lithophora Alchichica-D10 TaxID=1188229 RepID=A0A1J0A9E5_9CYAN|nr:acetate kinase [Gloeomargarita lithophora]APB32562.1 acetate kinase [Gloeomargarita lithophora Alchichica-D10]
MKSVYILVLNAGSSSQKSCLYQLPLLSLPEHPPAPLWQAHIDWGKTAGIAVVKIKAKNQIQTQEIPLISRPEVMRYVLHTLVSGEFQVIENFNQVTIAGHRIVHGGMKYHLPTVITPQVQEDIRDLIPLAPAHHPAHLEGIKVLSELLPHCRQIAVFDTAFHHDMPLAAQVYPIPYPWYEKGIRRYGFHGINHEYCAQRAAQLLQQPLDSLKLISCHLGNGASLCAIAGGKSVDTTMGFTPLEGVMMGSRSGSIDPGILLHWLRNEGLNGDQINHLLNQESGLKGVSQLSGDMRQILSAREQGHPGAKLAFDVYIHRLAQSVGAMLASLGGCDALIFTGGVGENATPVRAELCKNLRFLGIDCDLEKNQIRGGDHDIATPNSPVRILVITAEEDWAIAQTCWRFQEP